MATFDDFNFGDDAPTVDTDPTPDNDNLDANQSSEVDGIQDDTLNFPEPGQDDRFLGGEPSVWDVQGNPNEPGAQQDSIPPISNVRQMFDIYNQLPDTSASVREMFDAYSNTPSNIRTPGPKSTVREMFDAYGYVPKEDLATVREMFDAYSNLPDTPPEDIASIREMFDAYSHLPDKEVISVREMFDQYNNIPEESVTSGLEQFKEYVEENYYMFFNPSSLLEQLLDEPNSPLDAVDVAQLLIFLDEEDELLDRIFGVDELANSVDNPSGIGELFDKTIISGFDSWVSSPYEEIDGLEPNDFLALANFDGLELADYIGDIYINSDIVEFQNMDDTALENWDGLL